MSTYTASDDGKVVDGRIVVWIRPPRSSDPQEEERAATQESTAAQNPGQAKDEEKKGEEKQEPEKPEPGKLASPASQQKTSTAAQKPGQAKDKEKKGEEKQKPEKAEPGKLSNPSWHSESYEHGEKAEMLVEAPWLDGRKVRFIVERHAAGEEWEQVAEVTATVSGGRAKASVEIKGDE